MEMKVGVNNVIYIDRRELFVAIPFVLRPKARARPYETNKGRKRVYSPTAKNQVAFNKAIQGAIESCDIDFKTFLGDVGLLASIRSTKRIRGDSDNLLKQIKDALQLKQYPLVHDDRQIVVDYVEKVSNFGVDCVFLYLCTIENAQEVDAPFVFLNRLFSGEIWSKLAE